MRPLLALALGLALGLAPSAHAAPAWLPAASIPGEGTRAREAKVAFGPDGTLVAVWHEGSIGAQTINAAARPPGGPFGPVETLAGPTSGIGSPRLAVDAQGTALVTWGQVTGARFAVRPPGGPFGPAEDLPRPTGENVNSAVAVTFDAQGNALAAWVGSKPRMSGGLDVYLRATVRPPGGSFGSPEALETGFNNASGLGTPVFILNSVDVASAGAGDLIASWSRTCCMMGTDTSAIRVAVRPTGGPFGSAQTLESGSAPPGTTVYAPRPAGSAQGSAIVVWGRQQSDGSGNVAACARPPGGSFSGCTIENVSGNGTGPSSPALGVDAQGNAVASWSRKLPSGGDPDAVQVAGRPPGFSGWTPLGTYSEPGVALTQPELAASRQGAAIVAWRRGTDRIDGAARAAGAAFGASQPLSESGGNPFFPHVAMDPDGNGAAAWERGAPADTLVEVAGYDGASPRLSGLSIPPEGATAQALPFAVTATDVWSPVQSIDWSFGDGTGASGGQVTHAYGGSGGTFSVAATAADSLGNATSLSGATRIRDTIRPVLSRLRMTRRRFAVGRVLTPLLGSRVSRGSAFRFELSEPARVTIRIERTLRGRRVGPSCRVKSRRGRRCSVYRRVGVLTRRSRQDGANRVPFSGRLGRKALVVGSYRATLRAFDAAGNRSAARRIGFTTVRR